MPIYPPYVIERTSRGERSYDIFSRLLMDRIIFLGTGIDDNVANIIVAPASVPRRRGSGTRRISLRELARRWGLCRSCDLGHRSST